MARYLLLPLFSLFFLQLSALNIDMSSYAFYGEKSFGEIYLRVEAPTVSWGNENGQPSAAVSILLLISDKTSTIVAYDTFVLNSPKTDTIIDFLAVKRFFLPVGEYTVKVEAQDLNDSTNRLEMEQKLTINEQISSTWLSDIILLGEIHADSSANTMVKNGFYMEPLPFQYSDNTDNQLDFYFEAYDRQDLKLSDYFIQYSIVQGFRHQSKGEVLFSKYKKWPARPLEAFVLSLPTEGIRSGDFHVVVNIIDKSKNVIASSTVNFTKSNPAADLAYLDSYNEEFDHSFAQNLRAEDMDYILKAHLPVTEQHQVSTLGELLRSNKLKSQRQFIFQYWKTHAPSNPEEAYTKYMEVAGAVEKMFHCNVGYGFQSDRGHMFLKYGKPTNVLTIDTELDAPPYEIWYYNYLPTTRQTNVRFIFYNPTLSHNDFLLLHSTCMGERTNANWEAKLYGGISSPRTLDNSEPAAADTRFNRHARKYFNEF